MRSSWRPPLHRVPKISSALHASRARSWSHALITNCSGFDQSPFLTQPGPIASLIAARQRTAFASAIGADADAVVCSLPSRPKSVFPQHLGRCTTPRLARLGPEPRRSGLTLRRRGRLLDQDSRSPTAASASSFAACRPLDAALNAPYSGSPHPGRLRHEHSSTYCMHIKLNALTGRLKPLSASSPTGSMVAKLSTAARTRLSIRICPSLASPHNRAARFTTMPTAA